MSDPGEYAHNEHVRKIVDESPPLTKAERDRLSLLLRGADCEKVVVAMTAEYVGQREIALALRRKPGSRVSTTVARRWLSQQEAAEYLGVTDRTIRNYIRTGALKGHRLKGSRLVRIDRAALDAALLPVATC